MMNMNENKITEQEAIKAREKWVMGFNDTMLRIWQEKITLLGVIDTGRLLASPKALPVRADGRFFEVGLSQTFLEYGLCQDYGTGRETPRGNPCDIGRLKKRQRRKWFSTIKRFQAKSLVIMKFVVPLGHINTLSQWISDQCAVIGRNSPQKNVLPSFSQPLLEY